MTSSRTLVVSKREKWEKPAPLAWVATELHQTTTYLSHTPSSHSACVMATVSMWSELLEVALYPGSSLGSRLSTRLVSSWLEAQTWPVGFINVVRGNSVRSNSLELTSTSPEGLLRPIWKAYLRAVFVHSVRREAFSTSISRRDYEGRHLSGGRRSMGSSSQKL